MLGYQNIHILAGDQLTYGIKKTSGDNSAVLADLTVWGPIAVVGYLFGSFPTSYLLVKRFVGKDIRRLGTANVGTLNVHRATDSKLLTFVNLVGDVLKGVLAMVVGYVVGDAVGVDPGIGAVTGGVFAVAGHNYTVFLKFRGGKGIATSLPVLLYLEPVLVIVWIGTFLVSVAVTRLLVLGQILGTVVSPIVGVIFFPASTVPVLALALLVFVRHAPRIRAIVNRTEPKLYYRDDNSQER